jgi:phage terminase large subunit-like protein
MEYDITTQRHLAAAYKLLNYEVNNAKLLQMHKSTAKTRLILGGKRSGKTTWGTVECCWAALGIHPYLDYPPPPLKIRVCGVSNEGVRAILIPMFMDWMPRHAIKHVPTRDSMIMELTNGTFIEFKSYEQDVEKFEGTERHICWHDEEPPRAIYESNFMRTISSGINGKIIITGTPLHGMNWIYDELYDNPLAVPPAVEHVHVSIFDNPHLTPEALETIKNDPAMQESLDSVLYGLFVPKSGLVYKDFGDKHILPPIDKPNKEWMIVLGMDLHNRNPHGVVFMGLNKDQVWTVYDEIYEHLTIDNLAAKIKTKLGDRWPPVGSVLDTSSNTEQSTSGMSESQMLNLKHGFFIIDAHKDVDAGLAKMTKLLTGDKPGLKVTENCRNVIREFRHYVWDDWARAKDKYNPKELPKKKDDHLIDAIRYVTMTELTYRSPGWKYHRPETPASKTTGYYMRGKKK